MKYDPPPAYVVEHMGEREAVRASSPAQACLMVCENRFFGNLGLYRVTRAPWPVFTDDYDANLKRIACVDMRGGSEVEITLEGARYLDSAPGKQRAGRLG